MRSWHEERHLPWSAGQMFDLVADIERYPEFLPGWTHASIARRDGHALTVTQGVDLGILQLDFESHADLQRPEHLQISSAAGPFRRLQIDWHFKPDARDGCLVSLAVNIEMRSLLLEAAGGRLLELFTRDIYRRFRERATVLYGSN
ncbi:MAG: type II toxin-antitoxin system RatA family toxin [Gammaproteobacteria bacterium]